MNEKQIIKLANEFGIKELIVNKLISKGRSIQYEDETFTQINERETDAFTIQAFISGNKITKFIARPNENDLRIIFKEIIEESEFKTKEVDDHPSDTSDYKYINVEKEKFVPLSIDEAKHLLKKLVEEANKADNRILKKNTLAGYGLGSSTETYVSTTGTNLETSPSDNFSIELLVYFDDGKGGKGYSYTPIVYTNKNQVKIEEFINELKKDIKLKGTKKDISSGDYEVIFDPGAFMTLLDPFMMHINGRQVIDKVSVWKDSLGKQISSSKLNLVDAPIEKEIGVYITYDEDAHPTKNQHFIKNGVLQKFLTNQKFAQILKTNSSGNSNGSGASFMNPYIAKGTSTEKEIISSTKKGVYIRGLSGIHSGLNAISGEFSLELVGNIIEDGEIKEEISKGVISGNFFKDVLPNIGLVGNKRESRKRIKSPMIKLSKKLPVSA